VSSWSLRASATQADVWCIGIRRLRLSAAAGLSDIPCDVGRVQPDLTPTDPLDPFPGELAPSGQRRPRRTPGTLDIAHDIALDVLATGAAAN
jgi:hypothetical protein